MPLDDIGVELFKPAAKAPTSIPLLTVVALAAAARALARTGGRAAWEFIAETAATRAAFSSVRKLAMIAA